MEARWWLYINFFYKSRNVFMAVATIFLAGITLCCPQIIREGIYTGMKHCLEILIPSLFPFMFLSSFFVILGLSEQLKQPLQKATGFLFYLPGSTAPGIILSLLGGYPIGANFSKKLLENKEINSEQLNRMMCFCVNSGPAFLITVIGIGILKNRFLGLVLFFTQIIVSLSVGIICGIVARIQKKPFYFTSEKSHIPVKISHAFTQASSETANSLINISALVILFSAFISIIKNTNIFVIVSSIFKNVPYETCVYSFISFIEIISGCSYAQTHCQSLPLFAFFSAYGGVCTHFQISSILKETNFNYAKFHVFRILNSVLSYFVSVLLLKLFKNSLPVFCWASSSAGANLSSGTYGSIALVALCIYFVWSTNSILSLNENKKASVLPEA